MDIEEIRSILDSIENEASDIYDTSDNGCYETYASDPAVSDVEGIITTAWSRFDEVRNWVGTISNLVEDVRSQLEQDTKGEPPSACSRCGTRG